MCQRGGKLLFFVFTYLMRIAELREEPGRIVHAIDAEVETADTASHRRGFSEVPKVRLLESEKNGLDVSTVTSAGATAFAASAVWRSL